MLSNIKKIVISSFLSIVTLISIPFNAYASTQTATTLTELQSNMVKGMTARETKFDIIYTGPTSNISTDVMNALKAAETSDDYLQSSWTSLSCSMTGVPNNYDIKLNATYLTTAAQEAYVDTTVTAALASIITPDMNDFQKEKAIHDWILKTVSYDYTLIQHSAYAGLIAPNKTVCQGYALLMYKMLNQAGIQTKIITGTLQGGGHAWNMVYIAGNWYQVDATNDDTGNPFYNVTDSVLTSYKFVWDKTKFPEATTTYLPGSIPAPNPTTVTLDKTTTSLLTGTTTTLIPTIRDVTKTVTWASSNPAIATVTNGTITGVFPGTATITATTQDGATAACTVTVTAATTVVTLSKTSATFTAGDSTTLKATVTHSTAVKAFPLQTIVWSSSDSSIVTVVNGVIKGVKAGTATVTATTKDGVALATCAITVTPLQTVVTLNKDTATFTTGDSTTLKATVTHPSASKTFPSQTIVWSSSDSSIVSVKNGVATGVKEGTATVTATTKDGVALASCNITVTPLKTVVSLNKDTTTFTAGDSTTLKATVTHPDASKKFTLPAIVWSSSDTSIATVTNGGVKGLKAGTATITATTKDGAATTTCTITVTPLKTVVTLNQTSVSLAIKGSTTLKAVVTHPDASRTFPLQTLVWTSSDPSIATVVNGTLKELKAGTVIITATTKDNAATASCTVTVN